MIRSIKELRHYNIAAKDGPLGDVHDVYFDDHSWKVRYLVDDTGNWLPGRRVLIAPQAVADIEAVGKTVTLGLTRNEIRESPDISAHKPVSRQHEIAMANHFRWPRYWEEYPSGIGMMPVIPSIRYDPDSTEASRLDDDIPHGDPDLRSASEVEGYHVTAKDGDIGHIDDFLVNDADWAIHYLVVDTRNWWPGKKVLVAPAWTTGIDWADKRLLVDAKRETIKQAPEYKSGMAIDEKLERRLLQHYGQTPHAAE